jgi:hypothetical protein
MRFHKILDYHILDIINYEFWNQITFSSQHGKFSFRFSCLLILFIKRFVNILS